MGSFACIPGIINIAQAQTVFIVDLDTYYFHDGKMQYLFGSTEIRNYLDDVQQYSLIYKKIKTVSLLMI